MSQTRSQRRRATSQAVKQNLLLRLGAACKFCGATASLQFDCIRAAGPAHHKLNTADRLNFYKAQHEAGNLQLLCQTCHTRKTALDVTRRVAYEHRCTCPHCHGIFQLRDVLLLPNGGPPPL